METLPERLGYLKDRDTNTAYYAVRYNNEKAHMSDNHLGWQALIDFLGTMMWINVHKYWL